MLTPSCWSLATTTKIKFTPFLTSSIAYEFTRKVYEALDTPVENIASDYNSYDLIGKQADEILNKIKEMGITVAVEVIPRIKTKVVPGGTNDGANLPGLQYCSKNIVESVLNTHYTFQMVYWWQV